MKIFTHHPRVSLTRFSFCWWRQNRLLMMSQWPDNCDAITWIVISNLLDVDFINGDIHGSSCKKIILITWSLLKCIELFHLWQGNTDIKICFKSMNTKNGVLLMTTPRAIMRNTPPEIILVISMLAILRNIWDKPNFFIFVHRINGLMQKRHTSMCRKTVLCGLPFAIECLTLIDCYTILVYCEGSYSCRAWWDL